MNDILDFIRNEWFKEHVAHLYELDNGITVLDWHKPGTCMYRMRYVFDRHYVYISGDVGEAVYRLTEKAELESLANYDTYYFTGKLVCSSREKDAFDSEKAVSQIKDRLKERAGNYGVIERYQRGVYLDLIEAAKCCNSVSAWKSFLYPHFEKISEAISGCEHWVFDVGVTLSSECIGYLEGLKMAHAQLSKRGK